MNLEGATAAWYSRAALELAGTSPLQAEWARGVAGDPELLALIEELAREHRQPSLVFSVANWCGAPAIGYQHWRDWVLAHWQAVAPEVAARRTQTNEVGRCIPLLLGLARFDGPIALLEIGAAAGLCLAVDRYTYRFDDGRVLAPASGSGQPTLEVALLDAPVMKDGPSQQGPSQQERALADIRVPDLRVPDIRMPDIVWRAGIDLTPLDIRDPGDVRWLEALLPPDRPERLARLRAAIDTARDDPPRVIAGDALDSLAALAAEAPRGATLIVASLGTLVYLPPADRQAIPDAVAALGGHLLAFEAAAAVPRVAGRLEHRVTPAPAPFVLSVDGEPLACATAHGERVWWLPDRTAGQPELPATAT